MSKKLSIGLIHEGKLPPDYRVAMTPNDCIKLKNLHPEVAIMVQSSPTRAYKDEEYANAGIEVVDDVANCDVLLGVKEVPIDALIEGKTYFFFSHTMKKQPYNKGLMQAMIQKNIRMIDYEPLVDEDKNRLIGFGLYAGIVGAHYGIMMYGLKSKSFEIKPAKDCKDFVAMVAQYKKVKFPPFKTIVTGTGKVSKGAMQVLDAAGFEQVSADAFLNQTFDHPVYTNLTSAELYVDADNNFDKKKFYKHPELYISQFMPYAAQADVLINGIFWNERIVKLFEAAAVQQPSFSIKVIADISCDIHGSVPLTYRASTIAAPVYGVDKITLQEVPAFHESMDSIEMMTVDNLPNELPRDASASFGNAMVDIIIPELLKEQSDILDRATICKEGALTVPFEYLYDYVSSEEIV